jgi:hypothetical protein
VRLQGRVMFIEFVSIAAKLALAVLITVAAW